MISIIDIINFKLVQLFKDVIFYYYLIIKANLNFK
jgi:hypothetical protein